MLVACECVCFIFVVSPHDKDRLVGLVVKASALRAEDPGFNSRLCRRDFFPGRIMPVTKNWRYRVSAGTGWPGVSIL